MSHSPAAVVRTGRKGLKSNIITEKSGQPNAPVLYHARLAIRQCCAVSLSVSCHPASSAQCWLPSPAPCPSSPCPRSAPMSVWLPAVALCPSSPFPRPDPMSVWWPAVALCVAPMPDLCQQVRFAPRLLSLPVARSLH